MQFISISLAVSVFKHLMKFIFKFRDCCVALPHGATGLSADCDVVFPGHTHYF